MFFTTLFNPFCPLTTSEIIFSVNCFVGFTLSATFMVLVLLDSLLPFKGKVEVFKGLFPSSGYFTMKQAVFFVLISGLNLLSLVGYSYPVTTTLSFNLAAAFTLWFTSVVMWMEKPTSLASLLPKNAPSYLIPFLSVVELVSVSVRPITLCFRLLANMSAGHILLALICKLSGGLWLLGVLFGVLELMVCLVQAFVFTMLIGVYLEESLSH